MPSLPTQGAKPGLLRQLGFSSATALVISNMVGTGIFASTGYMAGQLGNGNSGDRSAVPVPVAGAQVFRALAVGKEFTCAITEQGAPLCWGLNSKGQLGSGDVAVHATPTPVAQP